MMISIHFDFSELQVGSAIIRSMMFSHVLSGLVRKPTDESFQLVWRNFAASRWEFNSSNVVGEHLGARGWYVLGDHHDFLYERSTRRFKNHKSECHNHIGAIVADMGKL